MKLKITLLILSLYSGMALAAGGAPVTNEDAEAGTGGASINIEQSCNGQCAGAVRDRRMHLAEPIERADQWWNKGDPKALQESETSI